MGLYYPTCSFSGIALMEQDAGVVLLKRTGTHWRPVSLPVWGHTDGYGSLERIRNDPNAKRIAEGFVRATEHNVIQISWTSMRERPIRIERIGDVVHVIARSVASPRRGVCCEGAELSYAFVNTALAGCLRAARSCTVSRDDRGSGLALGEQPTLAFYSGVDDETWFLQRLSAFAELDAAVIRGTGWKPPQLGQFSAEEQLALIHAAMKRFAGLDSVMAVLREMEGQVEE